MVPLLEVDDLDQASAELACGGAELLGPAGVRRHLAGADVSVHELLAVSHRTAIIVGLWKAPHLVRMVRAAQPA